MKYLILTIVCCLNFSNVQDSRLKGRYFVKFETKQYQDGYIDFKDNIFSIKHLNLLPYSGEINYAPASVYLTIDSDIFFEIPNTEIKKDTMKFSIHSKSASPMSYMDISIGSGKLIKLK